MDLELDYSAHRAYLYSRPARDWFDRQKWLLIFFVLFLFFLLPEKRLLRVILAKDEFDSSL